LDYNPGDRDGYRRERSNRYADPKHSKTIVVSNWRHHIAAGRFEMSAREMATIWIIGIAAVFVIIWDHRTQANRIVSATGSQPSGGVASNTLNIVEGPSTDVGTNNPIPMAGNEFGALTVYGNPGSGDAQANGHDAAFGNIFDNLAGQF
jgi:hypothetical protein